jgi:hypothetical protein
MGTRQGAGRSLNYTDFSLSGCSTEPHSVKTPSFAPVVDGCCVFNDPEPIEPIEVIAPQFVRVSLCRFGR